MDTHETVDSFVVDTGFSVLKMMIDMICHRKLSEQAVITFGNRADLFKQDLIILISF